MPFGDFLGNKKCINIILEHPINKKTSFFKKKIIQIFGSLFIKTFGYPEIGIRRRIPYIMKHLNIKRDDKILDAGCGPGVFCLMLSLKYNIESFGIDIDENDIKTAKKFKNKLKVDNVKFYLQNVEKTNFEDKFFNKIICSEVLEHIKNDKKTVIEFRRILKKNGLLIITVPFLKYKNDKSQMIDKKGHEREGYTLKSITKILETNSFKVIKSKIFYGYFSILGEKIGNKINKFILFPLSLLISKFDFFSKNGNNLIIVAKKV